MQEVYGVKAHESVINCIDGCGGAGVANGPPEIATGSRDGAIRIWDTRQRERAVANIAPKDGEAARDTWAVAFGNAEPLIGRQLFQRRGAHGVWRIRQWRHQAV